MISRFLLGMIGLAFWATLDTASAQQGVVNVTTYHYDNLRTGWNPNETLLTTSNVNAHTFGIRAQVALDDQVDAQPLVVNNVVYVVTENNTVYAIDGVSGAILQTNNLGPPVQSSTLPAKCTNNGSNVGIQSTPVIDVVAGVMYVVSYTWENNTPVYRIHQLALSNLAEINNSVVSASQTLRDGTVVTFKAQYQRQRAALLQANGNVYAAFASFCDSGANYSRGWVLGWQTGTLTPMPANELIDQQNRAESVVPNTRFHDYYLSTIWMSGYGIASDSSGDLFFTTANSDTVRTDNLQESAVRLSSDLTKVNDYFTPFDYATSDLYDQELGAGGLMVLPDQPGPVPHLAVAAGKSGTMYIMNRDLGMMGGFVAGGPNVPPTVKGQRCWCGPSYFQGSDGIGRVVMSHGNSLRIYRVDTTASIPLILNGLVKYVPTGQDYGFFTVVSSNGTQAGSAIIWAVGRPTSKTTPTVTLYAYSSTTPSGGLPLLYSAPAGPWPNLNGNANLVPVVANGNVYVASYQTLTIFGLLSSHLLRIQDKLVATSQAIGNLHPAWGSGESFGPRIFGTVTSVTRDKIDVRLRSGRSVTVDLTDALKNFQTITPYVGEYVEVQGTTGPGGTLAARAMTRAKGPEIWGPDVQ